MCGVAGITGLSAEQARPRLERALDLLVHRGPDGAGVMIRDGIALGMRRLAIIDLTGGDQPIFDESGDIAVVCNGELYDYREQFEALRARGHRLQSGSDVNVLPHLYEECGERCFAEVRGMFGAAIWDERRRRLVLGRDVTGKKPLYWAPVADGIAFASELPALVALLDAPPEIAPVALADYLRLGFVHPPGTIYDGVFTVPAACALVLEAGGSPRIVPYRTAPPRQSFRGSRDDALRELDARLHDAVRLRLRSDVPVGLFLSGGIDSGLVASYAAAAGARDLLCFVVGVGDPALDESAAAAATARSLGLEIERIELDFAPADAVERVASLYGQPFSDPSAIPSYYVSRAAAAVRKVVLNGDGGDEMFAGYRRYWAARMSGVFGPLLHGAAALAAPAVNRLGERAGRRSTAGFAARTLRGLAAPEGAERWLTWSVDRMTDADLRRCFPDLHAASMAQARLLDPTAASPLDARLAAALGGPLRTGGVRELMDADYRLLLPALLVKMDIATMANSLEARSPLLDVPLADFARTLPERWLINSRETKPLLRSLAAGRLPERVRGLPKRGFEIPVARWLAGELRSLVHDTLLAPDSRVAALGAPVQLRRFVESGEPFAGNYAQSVWALLMLELWLRRPLPQSLPFAPKAVIDNMLDVPGRS